MPKINGVNTNTITKINGVSVGNISKVNGRSGLFNFGTPTPTVTPTKTPTVTPTKTPTPTPTPQATCQDVDLIFSPINQRDACYCQAGNYVSVSYSATSLATASVLYAYGYGCDPNFVAQTGYYYDDVNYNLYYVDGSGNLTPDSCPAALTQLGDCGWASSDDACDCNYFCPVLGPFPFADGNSFASSNNLYTDCQGTTYFNAGYFRNTTCGTNNDIYYWDGAGTLTLDATCP